MQVDASSLLPSAALIPPQQWPKLSLLCDIVFRRVFEDPELLASLLNALLHLSGPHCIASLTVTPTQVSGVLVSDKDTVLDIRARCHDGRHFHVELQVRRFLCYPARMLYYWAGPYHGQLATAKGYSELKPVISIHILGFYLLPRTPRFQRHFHHLFEVRDRRTHHRLSDHLQLHVIELPKLRRARPLSTAELSWLYFLQRGHRMTTTEVAQLGLPELLSADEKLRVISQDRDLRVQYEQRMKAQRDALAWEHDHIAHWLDEGKKLGIDEGKKLGIDEGKRLGQQQTIIDLCELLGVELTPSRQTQLNRLNPVQLDRLRLHLKSQRAWPAP